MTQKKITAIVRAVKAKQPWDADETWPACFFCGLDQHDAARRGDKHKDNCAWKLAQEVEIPSE